MQVAFHQKGVDACSIIFIYPNNAKEEKMSESVYKLIELVGTSSESWEKAAAAAVAKAGESLRDLRIAEVVKLDMTINDDGSFVYRSRVSVSFKIRDD
jgi:flavin-binding protein dodecin